MNKVIKIETKEDLLTKLNEIKWPWTWYRCDLCYRSSGHPLSFCSKCPGKIYKVIPSLLDGAKIYFNDTGTKFIPVDYVQSELKKYHFYASYNLIREVLREILLNG